jgi:Transposase, Mutator family
MALDQSALLELLEALKAADADDVVRQAVESVFQALIDAEATARIGAAPHERTPARVTQRNGYRDRVLATTAGDVELRIPRLRAGSFFPSLLERRRRIDQALFAVVMEAYVHGVSTRKVDDLVAALGADSGISKSEVSRVCADLDVEVAAFRDRSLAEQEFPYLFVDATYGKARIGGDRRGRGSRVTAQAIVVATGVSADGRREVLGFDVGDSESGAFWTQFLRGLKARGLRGVQLVISDAHTGLKAAVGSVLLGGELATLPGALPAQRAGHRPQGQRRHGRRRGAHHLRPTRRGQCALPTRRDRRHARPTIPQSGADAARQRRGHHRLRHLPRRTLEEDLVHQPTRAGQQRNQTTHRRRRRLPQPGRDAAPRRCRARRNQRRMASQRPSLPI